MEFLEIAEKSMIFSKFMEFSVFRAIHPPETLTFLRGYWCFRHPAIFVEFWGFNKKAKICEKIKNFTFSHFPAQIHILRKMGPGAPKKPKKGWNCIGFKGPGASGPRGTKKREKLRKPRKTFCVFHGNSNFHAKSWKFLKNHHSAPSRNVGIPCKILYILNSTPPF